MTQPKGNVIPLRVPVTVRALTQRINRALSHKNERICALRGRYKTELALHDVGQYYRVKLVGRESGIIETHVNLQRLGRELKVLQPWEQLAE